MARRTVSVKKRGESAELISKLPRHGFLSHISGPCARYAAGRTIRARMGIALRITDLLVLLAVVAGALRAVRNGQSRSTGSSILSICMVLALLIFALVSFTAASGLAESSSLNQIVLLAFLVVTAIVARVSWVNQP